MTLFFKKKFPHLFFYYVEYSQWARAQARPGQLGKGYILLAHNLLEYAPGFEYQARWNTCQD